MKTPDEIDDLLALDSLGLLGPDEARELAALLASDPALRIRARELRESASMFAFLPEQRQPRPELKQEILREIDRRIAAETPAASATRERQFFPWALAALFAIIAAVSVMRDVQRSREKEHLQLALLRPPSADSLATAQISWDEKSHTGRLVARRMEALAPDRCYQIWIIDPRRDEPVSGGVFTVRADGSVETEVKPAEPVSGAERFLISLEKAGGVKKAEGPFVLAGS